MGRRRQSQRWSPPLLALREILLVSGDVRHALAARLDIGLTDAAAMDHLLSATEPLGPVELGHRLGIRSASATALVDRLEQAGHVRREPHPTDRRRQTLHPTDTAAAAAAAALRPMLVDLERAAGRLTPEQAETVTAFLDEVIAGMRRYVAQSPTR